MYLLISLLSVTYPYHTMHSLLFTKICKVGNCREWPKLWLSGCPSINNVGIFGVWSYGDSMGHMKNIGLSLYIIKAIWCQQPLKNFIGVTGLLTTTFHSPPIETWLWWVKFMLSVFLHASAQAQHDIGWQFNIPPNPTAFKCLDFTTQISHSV